MLKEENLYKRYRRYRSTCTSDSCNEKVIILLIWFLNLACVLVGFLTKPTPILVDF